jgi:hypothetical protein
MVDLIERCRMACDELTDVTRRAAIETVLRLSASQAAGGSGQQGKRRNGDVPFYGRQPGQVMLSDRKREIRRPRWATASLQCGPQHHHEPVPPVDLQPIQNDCAGIRLRRPMPHSRRRTSSEPDPVLTPIVQPAKCQPSFTKSDEEP